MVAAMATVDQIGVAGIGAAQAPPAPERARPIAGLLLTISLVFLALMSVILLSVALWSRAGALKGAETAAVELSRLVDNQVTRMFETADIVLRYMGDISAGTDWSDAQQRADAIAKLDALQATLPYVWQLWIMDAEGHARATTQDDPGPVDVSGDEYFTIHRQGDVGLYIGNLFRGGTAGDIVFVLTRRITLPDGGFGGIVVLSIKPASINAFYRGLTGDTQSVFELIGSDMSILAHDPPLPPDQLLAAKAPADLQSLIERRSLGTVASQSLLDGSPLVGAYRKLGGLPVYVYIGFPRDTVLEDWSEQTRVYVLLALAMLAGLVGMTVVAVRRARAEDRTRQELVVAKATLEDRVAERTASLSRTLEELTHALEQKDVLFKELNHRVKNNLQIMSSFISLQVLRSGEGPQRDVLQSCLGRIRSMGIVHELLYRTENLASVDFAQYLDALCRSMIEALSEPGRIAIEIQAERANLDLDTSVPLALIVNELVSNALKHAFPDNRTGRITIGFAIDAREGRLTIADDGVGYDDAAAAAGARSLGLRLIQLLTTQIRGTLRQSSSAVGSVTEIVFPRGAAAAELPAPRPPRHGTSPSARR